MGSGTYAKHVCIKCKKNSRECTLLTIDQATIQKYAELFEVPSEAFHEELCICQDHLIEILSRRWHLPLQRDWVRAPNGDRATLAASAVLCAYEKDEPTDFVTRVTFYVRYFLFA